MVKLFEDGDEEGECLAASSLGGCEKIVTFQGQRYGSCLYIGEGFEVRGFDSRGCGFAEG